MSISRLVLGSLACVEPRRLLTPSDSSVDKALSRGVLTYVVETTPEHTNLSTPNRKVAWCSRCARVDLEKVTARRISTQLAASFVLGSLAACSFLVDTSDLIQARESAAISGDASDIGSPDPSGSSDAEPPADGSLDHQDGTDPPFPTTPFSCAALTPKPLKCDDFDVFPLGDGWIKQDQLDILSLATYDFVSPERSLRVSYPKVFVGYVASYLRYTTASSVSSLRIVFDLKVSKTRPSPMTPLFIYADENASGVEGRFHLQLGPTKTHYVEETVVDSGSGLVTQKMAHPFSRHVADEQWARIDIDVQLEGQPHVTSRFNGAVVGEADLLEGWGPARLHIDFGVPAPLVEPPIEAYNVLIDNVVLYAN